MSFPALHRFSQLALPRLTLLLNHIVASEPVAMAKLQAHAGRTVDIRWVSAFKPPLPAFLQRGQATSDAPLPPLRFLITPAGLFESVEPLPQTAPVATDTTGNGLILTVNLPDPLTLARLTLKGERPEVNIEGDAALAEVASWMMKNLRWDIQDDIARWMGTTPAELLRVAGASIKQSLQRWKPQGGQTGAQASSR